MLKQVLKVLIVAAVLLTVASPAWANGMGVIFDPIPPGGDTSGGDFPYFLPSNGTWNVAWQPCAVVPNGPLPTGSELLTDGAVACLGFANDTGSPISSLSLEFTVTSALAGLPLTCTATDPYLSTNNCAAYSSPLTLGQTVFLTFTATDPTNDIPQNYLFYFGLTGISGTDAPPVELQVPTYDPSTLMLLTVGIAMLALGGIRRFA